MTTPENQIELFSQAVDALGGSRSAARAIGCSEKTIGRLISGQVALHEGFLKDMAAALLEHADKCRRIERRLSPAFPSNLIVGQPRQDGRRRLGRATAAGNVDAILDKMQRSLRVVGSKSIDVSLQWRIGETAFALIQSQRGTAAHNGCLFNVPFVVVPDREIPDDSDFDIVLKD